MPATTSKKPTPEQLNKYAKSLPAIYRDIVREISNSDPQRVVGDAVHSMFLRDVLSSAPYTYTSREVQAALDHMEQNGFIELDERMGMVTPTEVGEDLLAAISGKK